MGRWSAADRDDRAAVGLLATQLITGRLGESQLTRYFEEGLIIISWVANWKPLEIFLYDWWLVLRTRNSIAARECDRRSEALLVGFRVRLR